VVEVALVGVEYAGLDCLQHPRTVVTGTPLPSPLAAEVAGF